MKKRKAKTIVLSINHVAAARSYRMAGEPCGPGARGLMEWVKQQVSRALRDAQADGLVMGPVEVRQISVSIPVLCDRCATDMDLVESQSPESGDWEGKTLCSDCYATATAMALQKPGGIDV